MFKNYLMKFGIKIGSLSQNLAFAETVEMLTSYYPSLVVEGFNTDFRPAEVEVETSSFGFGICAKVTKKKRDIIVVGNSNIYDLTLESSKDYSILGGLFSTLEILDITKDADKIMKLLAEYVTKTYPATTLANFINKPVTRCAAVVVKKSNYVLVDGCPISYAEYNSIYC